MSRQAKWKVEKTKVKVVFRLQFHATHVPHAGWDKLFISFIPADSVKPTSKTTKTNVRNGTCKWADPIYETTRLLQDTKTKQYDEKSYKIVVAMGNSRSSILGEAMIDLAEYADALKPYVVSLPLQGTDAGVVLHVTVQLLTSKTGFREFEQQREVRERGLSTASDHISPAESSSSRLRISPSDENLNSHVDKMNHRVKFKDKLQGNSSVEEGEGRIGSVGFDDSSTASENLNAEKNEASSTNEIESLKSMASGDHSWNETGDAVEENIRLKSGLSDMESSINELKLEVSSLQREANDIGSDTQKFSRILISEITSGDQLVSEVSMLKSECSKVKEEINQLRNCKSYNHLQLEWSQGLLVVEDKIRELQSKACYGGYKDMDMRLFLSDMESILGVLLDLKGKIDKPEKTTVTKQFASETEVDTDIYQPELGPLHYLGTPGFTSQDPSSVDTEIAMKEKIFDLLRELDESKAEREGLTAKMDQMECYYESLVQELEETQRQLLGELQNLRAEHSSSLYTISCAKADMNEQILRFAEEKQSLSSLNKEMEKRAMAAEAALKRARLNYSIAVNHLQKDLELLSSQVVSMFEANDNLIKQALPDPALKFDRYCLMRKTAEVRDDVLCEAELYDMLLKNIHLEVFSKILHETLLDASVEVEIMREKIDELGWKLELSMEAKQRLNNDLNDAVLQNQNLLENLKNLSHENLVLLQKIDETESELSESRIYKSKYETCSAEKSELADLLNKEEREKADLQRSNFYLQAQFDDLSIENGNLLNGFDCLKDIWRGYSKKLDSLSLWEESMAADLESCDLAEQLEKFLCKICEKVSLLESENEDLTKKRNETEISLRASESESMEIRQKYEDELQCLGTKLEASMAFLHRLEKQTESVMDRTEDLTEAELNYKSCHKELLSRIDYLEDEVRLLLDKNERFGQEIIEIGNLAIEHGRTKEIVEELDEERNKLLVSLQNKSREASRFELELENLRTSLRSSHRDLSYISDLMEYSVSADIQLVFTRSEWESSVEELLVKHLELETALNVSASVGYRYMDENSELARDLDSLRSEFEAERSLREKLEVKSEDEMFEYLIDSEIKFIFIKTQSEFHAIDLEEKLCDLQKKHTDVESALNHCLVNEERCIEENTRLLISLDVLKSELKSSAATIKALTDTNDAMKVESEECRDRTEDTERSVWACEAEEVTESYVEEIERLMVSKTEAEVMTEILREKAAELTRNLSKQILRTEEFKNLSIRLKELKEKAEAECTNVCEKTSFQAPLTPQQESLRIIFIKEQYESKLLELKQQLSMSKKHGEEILMKLQDAIDEIEARKKAEALILKRDEELGDKLADYDMMKANLDCSLLSLECCVEDKQKLEASLRECERKILKMSEELEMMKGRNRSEMEDHTADELAGKCIEGKNVIAASSRDSLKLEEREGACSIPTEGNILSGSEDFGNGREEDLSLNNDHLRAETLRSSLDHLSNELERMKNENLFHDRDEKDLDSLFPDLERELRQLRQAKEELQSLFPRFDDRFGSGNAMERVLALEIELAEALRGKNRSAVHFQSSFLKQHRNDEAMLQSFRDINDLIEEMVEMKGRHASMETELREMHDRYSQLSLEFAEVEGERQKLVMTLKNVRTSKNNNNNNNNALLFNRSSSAALRER